MSNSRSKARAAALQGLYQWQLTGQDISSIDTEFIIDQNLINVDKAYFQKLLSGVIQHQRELDSCIEPFLDRPINEVNLVEYAILRIGAFEFLFCADIPYRVVLNEAIELAKCFGAEHGHRYINGILDKVARKVRAAEFQARSQ
ncbi:transcription antitermination factor NusB [Candidatus Nitrosoglobus terrae]|uniref:Transcription antitermination protein NusB n=1 Tax=Candidatus Nitrosoglobus terrae TaxID=1630141 RepID=A0A1Q2SLQ8_9GAMM|nr:transcription antitermination factor NusB [Candidatus Nitrosoglobus terrae]BAW80076.1 transcription antitermination factor NusB [Candidatus Nitrosoglobus terrae]